MVLHGLANHQLVKNTIKNEGTIPIFPVQEVQVYSHKIKEEEGHSSFLKRGWSPILFI